MRESTGNPTEIAIRASMSTSLERSEVLRRRRFFDGASSISTAESFDFSRARRTRRPLTAAAEEIISGNCFFRRRRFLGGGRAVAVAVGGVGSGW